MTDRRIIIESPLAGDVTRNYRFVLWCCRAVWLKDGLYALVSHMVNPWFMNDGVLEERDAGIDNPWVWSSEVPHWFFADLGTSRGMAAAQDRCIDVGIETVLQDLAAYSPECFAAFERGEWPPHTAGFQL